MRYERLPSAARFPTKINERVDDPGVGDILERQKGGPFLQGAWFGNSEARDLRLKGILLGLGGVGR